MVSITQYNLQHPDDPYIPNPQGTGTLPIKTSGGVSLTSGIGGSNINSNLAPLDLTAINNATASAQAMQKQFEAMMKDLDASQKSAAEAALKSTTEAQQIAPAEGWGTKIMDLLKKREEVAVPNREDIYSQALSKYGASPETFSQMSSLTTQLGAINQQMATAEATYQKQNEMLGNQPVAMPAIVGEQATLARQYNIQKSATAAQALAISAQLEAVRGNVQMAMNLADRTVDAACWEYTQKVNDMEWTFNTYADLFQVMDAKEKQGWDDVYTITQNAKAEKLENTKWIMDRVLEYAKAGVIVDYNPATDTIDTMNAKFARNASLISNNINEKFSPGVVYDEYGQGYSTAFPENYNQYTFTNTQLNKGASNANMDLATFSKVDGVSKNYFINNASGLKSAKEIIDDGITNKESKESLLATIQSSQAPQTIKDYLIAYLESKYPATQTTNKKWYEFWK